MDIRDIKLNDDLTHIALSGRLDTQGVQDIELAFLAKTAARGKATWVDMSDVDYISSLGMRMLLGAAQALRRKGHSMKLLHPQPLVREALSMAGLDEMFASDEETQALNG
jgi:anti-sigma B factor antagonist